jgi:hypothetical protein
MQSKLTEPAFIVSLQIQTIPRGTQPFSGSQPTEPAIVLIFIAIIQSHHSESSPEPPMEPIYRSCQQASLYIVQASLQNQLTATKTEQAYEANQHQPSKPAKGAAKPKRAAQTASTLNHPTPNGDNLQSQPTEQPVELPTIKQCFSSGSVGSVRFWASRIRIRIRICIRILSSPSKTVLFCDFFLTFSL